MIECYSLFDITIKGIATHGRPVEWDDSDEDGFGNNRKGQPIKATGWHTTCPFCGNLIHFKQGDLYVAIDDSPNNIRCNTCNAGSPFKKSQTETEPVKDKMVLLDGLTIPDSEADLIDCEKLALLDAELAKPL